MRFTVGSFRLGQARVNGRLGIIFYHRRLLRDDGGGGGQHSGNRVGKERRGWVGWEGGKEGGGLCLMIRVHISSIFIPEGWGGHPPPRPSF